MDQPPAGRRRGWTKNSHSPARASGEEARDFSIYCQRLGFFPEGPEHETVAELFLPLK